MKQVAKWLLILGLVGGLLRRGRALLRLQVDRHPGPQRGLRDPDVVRLLRRRQDRARPVRHPEPRVDPARRDPADPAGRRRRRGEPDLLDRQGHRPQGHRAGGVQQRPRQLDPGRVDDHPAVRQDPLPDPGALLRAQGQGSDPVAEDPEPAEQVARSSRATSTPSTSAAAPTASQAAAQAFFDTDAKDLTLRQSAVLASVLNNPTRFDPANGKSSRQEALKERYDYVLDGMADMGTVAGRGGREGRRSGCRRSRRSRPRASTAASSGHMLTLVKQELHALGFTDEEIDGGGLRVTTTFTAKAMQAAEQGVPRRQARGLRRQGAARRRRQRGAGHRRAARLLRRPGLPRLPDQLGRRRRHGRLDVQAVHAGHRARATATRSRTPSRATRRSSSPTASRSTTRAPAPTASATTTARP